ncbi:MAG: hypothetical protein HY428_00265 [Candidatus Levybacteria bacterium]|nr:hypothetical protein [Candidatus Levybacteria bacterium]
MNSPKEKLRSIFKRESSPDSSLFFPTGEDPTFLVEAILYEAARRREANGEFGDRFSTWNHPLVRALQRGRLRDELERYRRTTNNLSHLQFDARRVMHEYRDDHPNADFLPDVFVYQIKPEEGQPQYTDASRNPLLIRASHPIVWREVFANLATLRLCEIIRTGEPDGNNMMINDEIAKRELWRPYPIPITPQLGVVKPRQTAAD